MIDNFIFAEFQMKSIGEERIANSRHLEIASECKRMHSRDRILQPVRNRLTGYFQGRKWLPLLKIFTFYKNP